MGHTSSVIKIQVLTELLYVCVCVRACVRVYVCVCHFQYFAFI